MENFMPITSIKGIKYDVGTRLGKGGVAKVFNATRLSDKRELAFKPYVPREGDFELAAIHRRIKKNIKNLLDNPICDRDGKVLSSFVQPLDYFDLKNGGFAYVMEKINTDEYLSVLSLWHPKTYPDAYALCECGKNIAFLFDRMHCRGFCYKDINEGNIYVNPKTGAVKILDCDNINEKDNPTIIGTSGYIAPEVYDTHLPDEDSDRFSLATYFYRLLIGGYPLSGKKTQRYLVANDKCTQQSGKVIYNQMALFAHDPYDTSNSIRNCEREPFKEDLKEKWKIQAEYWDGLPEAIKKCFIQTFSHGLKADKKSIRTTDKEWYDTFDEIQRTGLVKCSCGKHNFDSRVSCLYCDKKLPKKPKPEKPTKTEKKPVPKPTPKPEATTVVNTPAPTGELTTVKLAVKRDVDPKNLIATARRQHKLPGSALHPELSDDNLMLLQYNARRNVIGAVNESEITMSVLYDGNKISWPPKGRIVLEVGMVITVMHRKLQLTVMEIS